MTLSNHKTKKPPLIKSDTLLELGVAFVNEFILPAPVFEFAAAFESHCSAYVGRRYDFKISHSQGDFYSLIGLEVYGPKKCPMVRKVAP